MGAQNHQVSLLISAVGVFCHFLDRKSVSFTRKAWECDRAAFLFPVGVLEHLSFLRSPLNLLEELPWERCAATALRRHV